MDVYPSFVLDVVTSVAMKMILISVPMDVNPDWDVYLSEK